MVSSVEPPSSATMEAGAPEKQLSPKVLLQRLTHARRRVIVGGGNRTNRVDHRRLEALFRQEPLLKRGITKHSGDLVKTGFTVVHPETMEPMEENAMVQAWWRRSCADARFREGIVSSHVLGDGLLEYEYDDGGASTESVPAGARLVAVHVIDPVGVEFEEFEDEDGSVRDWLTQRTDYHNPVRLHPDRYAHIKLTSLVGFKHGLSTVENAWHSALSKLKGDQALGEYLFFAAQPKVWGTVQDGTSDEVEAVTDLINSEDFTRGFVWTERLHLEQLNPTQMDPEPAYKVIAESVAAAIGLPMPMLVGAQAGQLSGSETNLTDYHADLLQIQETVLTEPVARIVSGITGLEPGSFEIVWQGFDRNTSSEAAALRDRTSAFSILVANGLDPLAAARIAGLEVGEDDLAPMPRPPNESAPEA